MLRILYAVLASGVLLFSAAPLRALADFHNLTITNNASQAIEYVQISVPAQNTWGDDWLGPSEVLLPGDKTTFQVTRGCSEDIRVTFADKTTKEFRNFDTCQYDLQVTSGNPS
ncbi:MAG: hypothetical protein ACREMP_01135 [Candidatus Tyrphobacter sp.]